MTRIFVISAAAVALVGPILAQTAPRAEVIDDTVPRAVPLPSANRPAPKAQVVDEEKPKSTAPATAPAAASKPKGPDEDMFDYAMLAYSQKEYSIASQNFGQYLSSYPAGRHVPQALFRLGECYLNLRQLDECARCFKEVVNRFPKDTIAPYAALRLGVLSYNAQDFRGATTYFSFCEMKSTVQTLVVQAAYYRSLACSRTGDTKKQIEALKVVVAQKKDNEYLQDALLNLATAYQTTGETKAALPILQELAASAKDERIKTDAELKAAVMLDGQGKRDEAAVLYSSVLKNLVAPTEARGAALVGYVAALYDRGEYDAVIDTYNRNAAIAPPEELRPRLLLQVGNASRMKKSYARAIDTYNLIVETFGDSPVAFEAAYWRIYCFYLLEENNLAPSINEFLDRYAGKNKDHEFINTARLLLADYHFNKQDFNAAAAAYSEVNVLKLAERLRPSTLFHKGWSESEAGRHNEAISTLSAFIKANPQSSEMPKALAKHGLSAKEMNDHSQALADFGRIIKEYPTSEAVELAYYLSGIVHEKQNDKKAMLKDFEALLANFPTSAASAEAAYKSGLAWADQKGFDKAIKLLKQAITIDPKTYGDIATQRVLLCYWAKEDIEALAREVDDYRGSNAEAKIPPTMLGFLGLKYYDRKDFGRAARYLTWGSTPDAPENTDSRIWNYLALSLIETKGYPDALPAIENYLKQAPESQAKAKAFETKARALIGLERFEDAVSTADDGLKMVKDGSVQALLLIAQGDALLAHGDKLEKDGDSTGAKEKWKAASSKFVAPSQILEDPVLTPKALERTVKALERLADNVNAEEMRKQLKKRFPAYTAED